MFDINDETLTEQNLDIRFIESELERTGRTINDIACWVPFMPLYISDTPFQRLDYCRKRNITPGSIMWGQNPFTRNQII